MTTKPKLYKFQYECSETVYYLIEVEAKDEDQAYEIAMSEVGNEEWIDSSSFESIDCIYNGKAEAEGE
jgi:hypothetical protein